MIIQRRKKTNHLSVFLAVFFFFYLLWCISNWPGLSRPWLYLDDFNQITGVSSSFINNLKNGRPVQGLWFYTFYLDGTLKQPIFNISLRLIHGAIHSLAASLAAYILWKKKGRWAALISGIPFLIWPFNGEAVLWRSAGGYPIAALLSILGVFLIQAEGRFLSWRRILGIFLIAAAMLSNQLAAFAGLVLWLICYGLDFQENSFLVKDYWKQFLAIISGHILGGLVSILLIRFFNPTFARAGFVADVLPKFQFLLRLNRWFLIWPGLYPNVIKAAHILLLAGSVGLFVWDAYCRKAAWRSAVKTVLIFTSLFVIPYTPLLILAETWTSWRIMYLAPFVLTMAINLFDHAAQRYQITRWALVLLLGILFVGYAVIGRVSSSEYVQVFYGDNHILAQLESKAEEWGTNRVTIASYPDYIYNWNPYQLKYGFGDSKISAYLVSYTWYRYISLFSKLETVGGPVMKECARVCRGKKREAPFDFSILKQSNTICVCP